MPVSSTITQSTASTWEATISSMAAIPMSLTEQHRHPLGRERNEVDWDLVRGSDKVSVRAERRVAHQSCMSLGDEGERIPSISVVSPKSI